MITIPTVSYAEFSTAHVRQEDADKITGHRSGILPGIIATYAEGWFCHTPIKGINEFLLDQMKTHGFSVEYIALQRLLMEQGIPYAQFDADAPVIEGLPVFDW